MTLFNFIIGFLSTDNGCVLFSSQIFAIQLLSCLCTQYALPKSLTVARLAISVMGTLLTSKQIFVFFSLVSHRIAPKDLVGLG